MAWRKAGDLQMQVMSVSWQPVALIPDTAVVCCPPSHVRNRYSLVNGEVTFGERGDGNLQHMREALSSQAR